MMESVSQIHEKIEDSPLLEAVQQTTHKQQLPPQYSQPISARSVAFPETMTGVTVISSAAWAPPAN